MTIFFAVDLLNSPEAIGSSGLFILSSSTSITWFKPVMQTLQPNAETRVVSKMKY
jgi:hypothetical protein